MPFSLKPCRCFSLRLALLLWLLLALWLATPTTCLQVQNLALDLHRFGSSLAHEGDELNLRTPNSRSGDDERLSFNWDGALGFTHIGRRTGSLGLSLAGPHGSEQPEDRGEPEEEHPEDQGKDGQAAAAVKRPRKLSSRAQENEDDAKRIRDAKNASRGRGGGRGGGGGRGRGGGGGRG